MQRSGHNCPGTVLGNRLRAALRKAGCTQVMRASYLSAGQKIMATIGVLNLANVTDAERAGKATGATAFIKQLPGAHGPTKNLMKGTGLEEAQIKGHYLILTWAEFTNLTAPGSAARRDGAGHFFPAAGRQYGRHQPDQPDGVRQAGNPVTGTGSARHRFSQAPVQPGAGSAGAGRTRRVARARWASWPGGG